MILDQAETVVIGAVVKFPAALIARDCALDRLHPVDRGETIRADISMVALHPPALEGQVVKRLLARDAQIVARHLPLHAMRIDPAAAAALVSDEVRELMFQRAPEFLRLAFL